MSGIRNSRIRLVGAAAAVVLGALSLTACNGATGSNDEGASPTGSSTASAPVSTDTSASTAPSAGALSTPTAARPGAPGSEPAGQPAATKPSSSHASHTSHDGPVTCEGSDTKTKAAPLNRPVNHMLLTVTNIGSRACYLYGYPAVRFGEAQSVPPVIDGSHPQAVVTLEPGESGYASVNLSAADGSGTNGRTVTSLTVYFQGRSGSGSVGAGAHPSLPAKGVYVDDSLKVTYWQQSMNDALGW